MTTSTLKYTMFAICVTLAASLLAANTVINSEDEMSAETARKEIGEMYEKWGRLRISPDEQMVEAMIDPEFYVIVDKE